AALAREPPVEGNFPNARDELAQAALLGNPDAILDLDLEAVRCQRPDEVDLSSARADVGKPARPADPALERMDVDVSVFVHLGERQARHVESPAVVEVEHVWLVDHRLVVEAGATLVAGYGDA